MAEKEKKSASAGKTDYTKIFAIALAVCAVIALILGVNLGNVSGKLKKSVDEATELQETVTQKEEEIKTITAEKEEAVAAAVAEKEEAVAAVVAEKEEAVAAVVAEKEEAVAAAVAEKDEAIAQKDEAVSNLKMYNEEPDNYVSRKVEEQMAEKEAAFQAEIESMKAEAKEAAAEAEKKLTDLAYDKGIELNNALAEHEEALTVAFAADKQEALAMAAQCDVIVAAMGENVMLCGENRDRQGLRLPGRQEAFVEELIKTGKPVVLVMFGGRAQVVSGLAERCAAVIQAWYPGEEGGHAVADILYGKVSPSAKLSVSYPKTEINEPVCYNYSAEQDTRIQWPFGYGLTYTTFDYAHLAVKTSGTVHTSDKFVELTFEVRNTGKVAADEIAQVYLSPATASQPLRPQQLQGFARVPLQPGEQKTVRVKLYLEQFGYYTNDGKRQWNVAPGQYLVKVGSSSADIKLQQTITLVGEPASKPIREYYLSESIVEENGK